MTLLTDAGAAVGYYEDHVTCCEEDADNILTNAHGCTAYEHEAKQNPVLNAQVIIPH
jgi:hypothetical protein